MEAGASEAWRVVAGLLLVAFTACGEAPPAEIERDELALDFAGTARCASCHLSEYEAWSASHHDRAMEEASPSSVLGDFSDVEFSEGGRSTRFFRRGDAFFAQTEGPDGVRADYPIRYTFGVEPLQQYLIELPGGRFQALTIAWDTRSAEQGGQRWFSLHPDEHTPPGDVLHWTGPANRWNSMCAACHSTNLRKNFDLERAEYTTTWSELDVACEACHGPGSRHVAWAEVGGEPAGANGLVRPLVRDANAHWVMDDTRGIARREPARTSHIEIETCAPCHSRRAALSEDVFEGDFLDAHMPATLEDGLYFPDGQIRDEVYVYGSFLQSRMYANGVTCTDCHEPHSLALRGDSESVCAQCHAPERFASRAHHHHEPGGEGARCVSCHMPSRTYMEIDGRRDHSFRVPRPDLSGPLGTPNACSVCHVDEGAGWAAAAVREWRGDDAVLTRHFGELIAAGRDGVAGSDQGLVGLVRDPQQPAIVRATALSVLAETGSPLLPGAIEVASRDPEPLLRLASARAAEALAPDQRPAALRELLNDPLRAVRIESARALAPVSDASWDRDDRRALGRALDEYTAVQRLAGDLPQGHVNLALLHLARGEVEQAELAYRQALAVGDYFVPAYVNLADLYRATGRDEEAEPLLRQALQLTPDSAEVHQALGLLLVRRGRMDEALVALAASARLAPAHAHFAYVHGVALQSAGLTPQALEVWNGALRRHPHDAELLSALLTTHRDAGNLEQALFYARALETARPEDPSVASMRGQLEAACRATGACPSEPR